MYYDLVANIKQDYSEIRQTLKIDLLRNHVIYDLPENKN